MANRKLSCAMLYRWFKCKLKPPKKQVHRFDNVKVNYIFAGSLESANSSILAARRFFKEVVRKKIRIVC